MRRIVVVCLIGIISVCPVPASAVKDGADATGDVRVVPLFYGRVNAGQAACSGALVAPRIVFTAAHCTFMQDTGVRDATPENAKLPIVGALPADTGLRVGAPGLEAPLRGPAASAAVIAQFADSRYRNSLWESGNPNNHGPLYDFAVLVLDQPLSRAAFRFATAAEVAELARSQADVTAIGYGVKSAEDQANANAGRGRDPKPALIHAHLRPTLHPQNRPQSDYLPDVLVQTQLSGRAAMGGGDSGSPLWARIGDEDVYVGALSGAIGPSAMAPETDPVWSDPYWGTRAGGSYYVAAAFTGVIAQAQQYLAEVEANEQEQRLQPIRASLAALQELISQLRASHESLQKLLLRGR